MSTIRRNSNVVKAATVVALVDPDTSIIKMARVHFATIALDRIKAAPYNPSVRTERIDNLRKEIQQDGQVQAITVVDFGDGTFVVADGHRRIQVLTELGAKNVKALVYKGDNPRALLDALFKASNNATRAFGNKPQTEVAFAGGPIFNAKVQKQMDTLALLFGPNVPSLVRENVTSYGLSVAQRLTEYIYPALAENPESLDFRRKYANSLLWLLRHKQQQYVIAYIRANLSSKELRRFVENDRDRVPRTPGSR